jgi:hypothetical protein
MKGIDHFGDLGIDGKTIFISQKICEYVNLRGQWRVFVNLVMTFLVP